MEGGVGMKQRQIYEMRLLPSLSVLLQPCPFSWDYWLNLNEQKFRQDEHRVSQSRLLKLVCHVNL